MIDLNIPQVDFTPLPNLEIFRIVEKHLPRYVSFSIHGYKEVGMDQEWMRQIYADLICLAHTNSSVERIENISRWIINVEDRYLPLVKLLDPLCTHILKSHLNEPLNQATLALINSDIMEQDANLQAIGRPSSRDLIMHAMGVRRVYW